MATNYTTTTAALRATKIDGRQIAVSKKIEIGKSGQGTTVSEDKVTTKELDATTVDATTVNADTVMVKHQGESKDVVGLISQVASSIKTGIDIGTAKDPIDNGVDEGSTNAWTDVSKMNFKGNVTVLKDPVTGVLNFYFAKLRESYGVSSATDFADASANRYLYTGTGYTLPAGKTDGSTYKKVGKAATQTIKINNGDWVTLDSLESTVKVVLTKNGTDYTLETPAIDGSTTTVPATGEGNLEGVSISVSSIKKYVEADLSDGFLPDTIDCKVTVTIDESKFIAAGGTYKVKVTVNGVEKATSERFVYTTAADSTFKVGSVSATYTPSTSTHQVSGVTYYDAGGTVDIEVTGVEGTCQMSTANLNKFKVSDNSGQFTSDVTCTPSTDGVTATGSGASTTYGYTKTGLAVTSSTPAKVSGTVTAQAYNQEGSLVSSAKATKTISDGGSHYVLTTKTADGDNYSSFYVDGKRVLEGLSVSPFTGTPTLNITTKTTYDKTQSLTSTAYANQLLVQGGRLKHPSDDVTSTYASSLTGVRYYVRPIKLTSAGGSASITKLTVKVTGTGDTDTYAKSFPTGIKILLGCGGKTPLVQLDAQKNTGINGNAAGTPTWNSTNKVGSWTCNIDNGVWSGGIVPNSENYYLIIAMDESAPAAGMGKIEIIGA